MKELIDIQIEDVGKFTDVALLVDKPQFLEHIKLLREKYLKYIPTVYDKHAIVSFEAKLTQDETYKAFYGDLEALRRLFNRPIHFRKVIEACVVTGIVINTDYQRAYLEEEEIYLGNPDHEDPETKYSIVIHPSTELKDVEEVFQKFKQEMKDLAYMHTNATDEEKENYNFGYWFNPNFQLPQSVKEKIKMHRDWYVRRENGENPFQIALNDNNSNEREYITYQDMSKSVKSTEEDINKSYIYLTTIDNYIVNVKEQLKRYRKLLKAS